MAGGRRLGRAASTVSRELRRNAATRGGNLDYLATTAHWHAERSARRPKRAKLATNPALRTYVQDRLAGAVHSSAKGESPAVQFLCSIGGTVCCHDLVILRGSSKWPPAEPAVLDGHKTSSALPWSGRADLSIPASTGGIQVVRLLLTSWNIMGRLSTSFTGRSSFHTAAATSGECVRRTNLPPSPEPQERLITPGMW